MTHHLNDFLTKIPKEELKALLNNNDKDNFFILLWEGLKRIQADYDFIRENTLFNSKLSDTEKVQIIKDIMYKSYPLEQELLNKMR